MSRLDKRFSNRLDWALEIHYGFDMILQFFGIFKKNIVIILPENHPKTQNFYGILNSLGLTTEFTNDSPDHHL